MELMQGDSAWLLNLVKSGSIDLVVTSPPYDNLRDYKGYSFNFEGIAEQLVRVLSPSGVIVWVVGDAMIEGTETGTSFKQALHFKSLGLNLHDTMIYEKAGTGACGSNFAYWQSFEYMFIFSKGRPKTTNLIKDKINSNAGQTIKADRRRQNGSLQRNSKERTIPELSRRTNIWRYAAGFEKTGHPAVFPLQLATDHIISWSNPGDTVLEPFLGSGTTGVAAVNTGREFIGIEQSMDYFKIACERIELAEAIKDAERLQA